MAKYTLIHTGEVEVADPKGDFKKLKKDLESEQVAISLRRFPAHSGQRGGNGHKHQEIEEVLYVISGELVIKLDDEQVTLKAGDAIRFSADVARAYQNDSAKPAETLIASPILPGQRTDGILVEGFWKA